MRLIKLLLLFILVSINGLSQNNENIEYQYVNIDVTTQNELDDLDNLLNLSQEQKEQIFEIIRGVLIKNKQVKSMKLIEVDKIDILNQNNDSKIIMIMNVLNGKQKLPYEKYLASQIVSDELKD